MRKMTISEITKEFSSVTEGAIISLKNKGYRYLIWNACDDSIDPIFAKNWDTMISAVKDLGKGAIAAEIV